MKTVRPHQQHSAQRRAVGVEEVGSAMQADRGLPRARAALDDERRVRIACDQAVLVGLDRRDDVAHAGVARPFELFEEEVVDDCRGLGERPVESPVADSREDTPLRAEAAAESDAVRVGRRRRVERARSRSLPVDDDRAVIVVDPPAADVDGSAVASTSRRPKQSPLSASS
jgi:hypothetical protein